MKIPLAYAMTAEIESLLTATGAKLLETVHGVPFYEIEKDIIDRDYRDMHRETSPLKQAEDAVLVDSSEMDIDEVVEAIRSIYEEKKGC